MSESRSSGIFSAAKRIAVPMEWRSWKRKRSSTAFYVGPGKNHCAVYQIRDEVLLILVVKVGDRKEIYRRVK